MTPYILVVAKWRDDVFAGLFFEGLPPELRRQIRMAEFGREPLTRALAGAAAVIVMRHGLFSFGHLADRVADSARTDAVDASTSSEAQRVFQCAIPLAASSRPEIARVESGSLPRGTVTTVSQFTMLSSRNPAGKLSMNKALRLLGHSFSSHHGTALQAVGQAATEEARRGSSGGLGLTLLL